MEAADAFLKSFSFFFVLLNPFLMMLYLLDLMRKMDGRMFRVVLYRASLISFGVFSVFVLAGDAVFRDLLQVRFASFQIFGGLLFLLIGFRFFTQGPNAVEQLRGEPRHVAGSIALPFMIGPGTISASILAGAEMPAPLAVASVASAMLAVIIGLTVLKLVHDRVRNRYNELVERYIELTGRVSALLIGTIAIEMILQGIERWLNLRQGVGLPG